MKNFLYIIALLIIFASNLDAQCKRGEQLRITNDVKDTIKYALIESSQSVVEMYRDKYADAYFKFFK